MLRRASVAAVFLLVVMPATVQAFDHHHHHTSSSGGGNGCGGSSEPSTTPAPSPEVSAPPSTGGRKRIFVTSGAFSGALGSVSAADAHCQDAARVLASTGVFRAWLSDSTADAYDRMAGAGPWYTTGDEVAFALKTDMRGAPSAELLDEYAGHLADGVGTWSGSDSDGIATGQDCNGWTNATSAALATTGDAAGSTARWGGGATTLRCDARAPLICVQQ